LDLAVFFKENKGISLEKLGEFFGEKDAFNQKVLFEFV